MRKRDEKIKQRKSAWETSVRQEDYRDRAQAEEPVTNLSGVPIDPLYTPADRDADYLDDLGFPGEYPFTRGVYRSMYRGRLWTMRQFAGFGTAKESNERFRYLLKHGQTGLSVAFDLPTLMGRDSDDPFAAGEVGRCGVAIDTLADMEALFKDIALDRVTTSMTINAPAAVLFAMYIAVAEKQGVGLAKLQGTLQNDILKEYIAQKEWIYPPGPSLRLITDTIRYAARHLPKWHPVSISGYHIREAGATAVQELAFTLYDGLTYVEAAIRDGLSIDDFAPRLSFFFNAHNDFFEEIAKYRAARRIWAREIKKRYHPKTAESMALRFHAQTAGCTLTAQQPYNNIVRVALQALAAVLGGTQSLHTDSMDETYALPSEEAVTIALRTQQIIAHESGVAQTIDPLGGAYYLEALTDKMEEKVYGYFERLDALGGMVSAIERGFPQREIQEAAYRYQREIDSRKRIIVGVNAYATEGAQPIETLKIEAETENTQIERLRRLKRERDGGAVAAALDALVRGAESGAALTPLILDAVRCYATVGEISGAMAQVFGVYEEPGISMRPSMRAEAGAGS